MSLPLLIQGLGQVGIFASRAFLPAFVTALILRFGPELPWIGALGLLSEVQGVPTWFTHDITLITLGILAVLEIAAERSPEAQDLLDQVHDGLKVAMAALTYLGVLSSTDRALAPPALNQAEALPYLAVVLVGVGTYVTSQVRGAVIRPLNEIDEGDDLGLRGLIRWVEDLFATLSPIALIVLPVLTLGMLALALVGLGVARRWVAAREAAAKRPCASCGEPIFVVARFCPSCKAPVPAPRAIGLLGQAKAQPADPTSHPFQLVAVRRCPACASRLRRRTAPQVCDVCGEQVLNDPAFVRAYVTTIARRVPLVGGLCFVLGLIPVLGVVPGVILYRLCLVAPFRHYLPSSQTFALRWGVRLLTLVLVAFQWVPLFGGFALLILALVSSKTYRGAFEKLAHGV